MVPQRASGALKLLFITAALVLIAGVLQASLTAEEGESWFEATLGGAPMGFLHQTVTVRDEGMIATHVASDFTMRRGDELVAVKGTDEWTESAAGEPVEYRQTRKMALETHDLQVTVDPGRLRLRKSDGEDAVFSSITFDGDLLFPRAIDALHASEGFREGSTYDYTTFEPDFENVATFEVTVLGDEELEIMGQVRSLNRLLLKSELYEAMEIYEWRDDTGRLWRQEIPDLASATQRTTSDVASREGASFDILAAGRIESNVTIPSPRTVDEAVYELWLEGGKIADEIIEDGRQEIVGETDRGVLLKVRRSVPAPGTTMLFPVRSTPLKDYLDGNPMMQTWYPILLGTAAKSVWGSGDDTWRGAVQIESWVNDNIEYRGLGTAFASAREVLEQRSGDCTEHAILMAAMARAVRIPSKVAAGLLYHQGTFAYHMWVEVWTGEDWYALDPTIGEGSVDATHLKLAESAVPGGRVTELSLGIARLFSRLGVRVVEYTIDGDTVTVPAE